MASGAVFALFGLGHVSIASRELPTEAARRVYRYIALGVILVALSLTMTTFRVAIDSIAQVRARQITSERIDSTELENELNRVTANQRDLLIELNGPQDPSSISELAEQLEVALPILGAATLRTHYTNDLSLELTAEPEP